MERKFKMFSEKAMAEVGQVIKRNRIKAGVTQADLATKLGYKSPQFVSNWERGEAMPPLETLPKIAALTKSATKEVKEILVNDLRHKLDKLFRH